MLSYKDIVQNYIDHTANGFDYYTEDRYTVISTPYLYSDGDVIELFMEQAGDTVRVSDLGETARKLAIVNFNWTTRRNRALFSHIINATGVSSSKGMLYVSLSEGVDIGGKISDLIQSIQQTDNLLFTVQEYATLGFREEVEKFLQDKGFEPELNYEIEGVSGKRWSVHFHLHHRSNILLKALSATSKGGTANQVHATYVSYDDIKKKYPSMVRTVMLDDTFPIWDEDILSLVQAQIDIELGYWSRRDAFSEQLREIILK